ncbi:MAG TPA: hypothetical protein VEW46_07255 [Pyrinomonadaceae bacterium]|nr:hypothetical protein [Pyrinomonadaceae bacterium]
MKKAIALTGTERKGKSTTIRKAYDLLIAKYPNASVEHAPGRWGIDIKVVVRIGEVKIGIESRGDPGSALTESLNEFVRIGCIVIVCARRTSGRLFDAVNNLADQGYELMSIPQVGVLEPAEQKISNQEIAEQILSEIEDSLSVAKAQSATP